ncbi:hypothetical protein DFH07DRAFT_854826 [Mycena maculata]|uniref:Mitochondrial outer membrane transport complex Sam37/metaxin N-terminal domain-containing protein n=1 Tax=Mycena maculata TaxID=230809 RepID=A0AAD7MMN3_9AGAR|nr:hypothetical protein DFH07DRAFT_854826 [Mycena maculata]
MSAPVLHIWSGPGQWGLPSFDPHSLVAVLYLQLAMPGQFEIVNCTNPDLSPSGTLPFLSTHDGKTLSPLSSILKYISGLKDAASIDSGLNSFETSQKMAWCSHVDKNLGDLTAYMLYSLPTNWTKLIHPTLAHSLPVPQRYYVPGRMRNIHRPRLEAAGLWNQQPVESPKLTSKDSTDHKEKIAQAFHRDKVLQIARDSLDIYKRLLGENQFIFNGRLTTLDIALAAHLLVILKPPFPDPLLSDLLVDSYPTLVSHAERVLAKSREFPVPMLGSPGGHSIRSLFPQLDLARGRGEKSEDEVHYERMSSLWVFLAATSVGLYLMTMGSPVRVGVMEEEE